MSVAVDSIMFDRFSHADTNLTVARRGTQAIGETEFRTRVCAWRNTFVAITNSAVALHEADGVEFAAALVGAWYANKTVYLPGDAQPRTCRALESLNVAFVGAFPSVHERLLAPTATATATTFDALDADGVHLIIFTSGSTGAPQPVHKRLTQLLAEIQTLEHLFATTIGHSDVVATVSHQHIYGLLFKILWPLVYKHVFVAESLIYPEQLLAALKVRQSAVVSGPAHLKRLPETLDWRAVRDNVSAVFSSGGPLALSAASTVESLLGSAPIEVYGSSETGGVAYRQCTHATEKPWTPMPGVDVNDADGRLTIRSAHLPDNEWLVVADNASFDDQGRFTLHGRADRIVKIEGKRVSLVGIEESLMQSGLVADVRVLQLEAARDELGAIVVPSAAGWDVLRDEHARGLRARLDAALALSIERLAHPRRWRWVDTLPVDAVGKTSSSVALELFAEYGITLPATRLVESSTQHAIMDLFVSPHLAVFDGHFRKLPVLAGVVQVDWAMLFGVRYFRIDTQFARLEAIKFLRVYQPGPMLRMTMQWNPERHLLSFRFESGDSTHSSGRIFFGA